MSSRKIQNKIFIGKEIVNRIQSYKKDEISDVEFSTAAVFDIFLLNGATNSGIIPNLFEIGPRISSNIPHPPP